MARGVNYMAGIKRRHPNPPAPLKSSRLPPARSRSLIPRPAPPFPRPVHRPAFPTPDDRLIRAINTLGETYNIPCPELLYLSTQRRERGLNQEEEARWRDLKREEEMRKARDRFFGRRRREEEEWEEWEAWEREGDSRDVERDEESASRREMHRRDRLHRIDELLQRGGFAELDDDPPDKAIPAESEHPAPSIDMQSSDDLPIDDARPVPTISQTNPMNPLSDIADKERGDDQKSFWKVTRPGTIAEPSPVERPGMEHTIDHETASLACTQRTSLLSPKPNGQSISDFDECQSEAVAEERRRLEGEWRREVEYQSGSPDVWVESAYRPACMYSNDDDGGEDVVGGDDGAYAVDYAVDGEYRPLSEHLEQEYEGGDLAVKRLAFSHADRHASGSFDRVNKYSHQPHSEEKSQPSHPPCNPNTSSQIDPYSLNATIQFSSQIPLAPLRYTDANRHNELDILYSPDRPPSEPSHTNYDIRDSYEYDMYINEYRAQHRQDQEHQDEQQDKRYYRSLDDPHCPLTPFSA